ncbi:MAG: outer membrane protein assembly factor BamE [Verrucomicrobia bacterium]|nr:outer membrane protein assembly factor BamE [Verrucomicrobiota bacterium]
MKWIVCLLLLAACRKGIEGESPCRESPLSLTTLRAGMGQEEIAALLGRPFERLPSPFGRETWVYLPRRLHPLFSNTQDKTWHLIRQSDEEVFLVLHFDEEGKLQYLVAQKKLIS